MAGRRQGEREAGPKDEREPFREAPGEEHHGPDWEQPGAPEWAPPETPGREAPPKTGAPSREGREPGAPAEVGDPPLERPLDERSRRGGPLPRDA